MHHFLVFTIFYHSVAVLALNAIELAKQFPQFFQRKIIGPRSIRTHVEVILKFRITHTFCCKSKLSQIVSAVVPKVQNSPSRKLLVDLRNNFFEVFWGDSRQNKYQNSKLGCLGRKRNLLIDKVAAFGIDELLIVKHVFLYKIYRMLCEVAALNFQGRHAK